MIDLHTHSTASDGDCAPARLMDLAREAGLAAIALTDHDTLDGLAEARARAEELGLRFLAGVEIEIECAAGEFHLLGLHLHGDTLPLAAALGRVQQARRDRNRRMVAKLQADDYPLTMEDVEREAGGSIVSRAHFAQVLVRKRIVPSVEAAFKRLIGKGLPYYEPRACLALSEATGLIQGAGGRAVIAHPVSLGLLGPALRTFLGSCREQGVSGLEAWHPTHSVRQCRRFERLAGSLGMFVTGGSDFHGSHMPRRPLGMTAGGLAIPDRLLEPFLEVETPPPRRAEGLR